MTDPLGIKVVGKLGEELGELQAAAMRCLIQGIKEKEPVTGKPNKQWLEEEVADVLANLEMLREYFDLSVSSIVARRERKIQHLRAWHKMT